MIILNCTAVEGIPRMVRQHYTENYQDILFSEISRKLSACALQCVPGVPPRPLLQIKIGTPGYEARVSFYRISAVMQHQGEKTAASSSKRRHDWVMKLNRKRVEPNQEFQGLFCSIVSGKLRSLLNGKPG